MKWKLTSELTRKMKNSQINLITELKCSQTNNTQIQQAKSSFPTAVLTLFLSLSPSFPISIAISPLLLLSPLGGKKSHKQGRRRKEVCI